jgi:hypothetical protein
VQLIQDALDFPASLAALAEAESPGWGVQVFGGAQIFEHEAWAMLFQQLCNHIVAKNR